MEKFTPIPKKALQDTWQWLLNAKAGWAVAILVGSIMSAVFVGDSLWSRVLSGLIGALATLFVIMLMTYIVHLWITPIRQRNKARVDNQKLQTRIQEMTTPKLRVELENTPETNDKHVWWHLIVHNDSSVPIRGCYAQLLDFSPNISNRLYQAIGLPWSSFGGTEMEIAVIAGHSFRYLDFVMTNRRELYVVTFTPDQRLRGTPFPEPSGKYTLRIQVGSKEEAFCPSIIELQAIFDNQGHLDVKQI